MQLKWFGSEPWGPVCRVTARIDIPVGDACEWCGELFEAGDFGIAIPADYRPWHQECFQRSVYGSVGHQLEQCECHGCTDTSEVGISRRQAARASVDLFGKRIKAGLLESIRPPSVN